VGVRKEAVECNAEWRIEAGKDGPSTIAISDITDTDATDLSAVNDSITVVEHAGPSMLAVLPRLSSLGEALLRISMPGFQSAERFDVSSASWTETGDPYVPGAYRLRRGFETLYIYRSETDVGANTAAVAPVHVVKHLAANDIRKTLVSYQEKIETILLPQGSDLPGLYARAIVAMSGHPPETKHVSRKAGPKRKCLLYAGVERYSADLLVTLFTT
jgi:hypothetical protein